MEPTPKEHADAVAKRDKIVDHLMKEGYAEDKESAELLLCPLIVVFSVDSVLKVTR